MSAQSKINQGSQFPYDRPDDDDTPAVPATDWAHVAARGILADLTGRAGIGNELEQYDEEIRNEIITSAAEIIRLAHSQATPGGR